MMTIGRFAEATGLTVKALRHYAEIGLLAPASVDPGTGYRYYEPTQVEDAVAIRRLRALELPLEEIRSLLRADANDFRSGLAAHGYHVAAETHDKQMLLIELAAIVEGGGATVELENEPELRFAGLVEAGWPAGDDFRGDDEVPVQVYAASAAVRYDYRGALDQIHVTAQRFIATVLGQGDLAADQDRLPRRRPRPPGVAAGDSVGLTARSAATRLHVKNCRHSGS